MYALLYIHDNRLSTVSQTAMTFKTPPTPPVRREIRESLAQSDKVHRRSQQRFDLAVASTRTEVIETVEGHSTEYNDRSLMSGAVDAYHHPQSHRDEIR